MSNQSRPTHSLFLSFKISQWDLHMMNPGCISSFVQWFWVYVGVKVLSAAVAYARNGRKRETQHNIK